MGVIFCAPFDSDTSICIPSDIAPDSNSGMVIDTSVRKFGAGSLQGTGGTFNFLTWDPFSLTLGDVGAVGFWVYFDTAAGERERNNIQFHHRPGLSSYRVVVSAENVPPLGHVSLNFSMRDVSSGVFNLSDTSLSNVGPGWHYIQANWLWNDAGGVSEMSWDGVVKITSTAGNTKTRDSGGAANHRIRLFIEQTAGGNPPDQSNIDDIVIWDTRQNIGNFTPPSSAQCVCAGAGGQISFGSQMNRFGAGFSR